MFKKWKEARRRANESQKRELTRAELNREINHYKTILSGKWGKPTKKNIENCNYMINLYENYLANLDKLDKNHDGILQKEELV
jgi:hypothetical protein